jgi:hypothetical protein
MPVFTDKLYRGMKALFKKSAGVHPFLGAFLNISL